MSKKIDNLSFEDALKELEEIVKELEEGNLDLQKSLSVFQRGIETYKHLDKILSDASGKVNVILGQETGNLIEENFDIEF